MVTYAPFLKWVGGKSRLMPQLDPMFPPGMSRMRHVEVFTGGAAMFFARAPERALLNDINEDLIMTYAMVRDHVEEVIGELYKLAPQHSDEHYYAVREKYNRKRHKEITRAAMFIYLNKTCFNGLFRVNRKGEFNVPMGRYKNPNIVNEDALRRCSEQLKKATLRVGGFEGLLGEINRGDFVYFDPPYEPLSRTASFTSYAQDGFTQADQTRLRDVFAELDRRGAKLMLSNSDVPFIRGLYSRYEVRAVSALRMVNSDATARGPVSEVVVTNY